VTFKLVTTAAGTLTPSIGGKNGIAVGQSVGTLTTQVQVIAATGAGALTFTPDANWTGTIDNVSVKQITTTPSLVTLINSDGVVGVELRSGGSGLRNTYIGISAGMTNSTGNANTAIGYLSFQSITSGSSNTAIGAQSLLANTTGVSNIATGYKSLNTNTTGGSNTATGMQSLRNNTTGSDNTANGINAMPVNITGSLNTAVGSNSMAANTTGASNTAIGYNTLSGNSTGSNNTALGFLSGFNLTTGSSNIIIGSNVNAASTTATGQLDIGNVLFGSGMYSGATSSAVPVAGGRIGIGTTTPASQFQVASTTANATTSIEIGQTGQKSCLVMYDVTGAVQYVSIVGGSFVISATSCK
jgi:hypothetical protein